MKLLASRQHLVFPAVVAISLLVVAIVFWKPLYRWFAGPERPEVAGAAHVHGAAPRLPVLTGAVTAQLQEVFAGYERMRALLAADSLDGLPAAAQEVAQGLERARLEAPEEVAPVLDAGTKAALRIRDAGGLAAAREHFGQLSEALVKLAALEPALQKGRHIFECPMVEGFARWFQPTDQMANPYMGQRMLKCGSRSDWGSADPALAIGAPDEIAHYTCPMHPSVKQATPGTCPLCGMDLVPVTRGELQSGVVLVDDARRQRIGVKTAKVRRSPLTVSVRALGKVTWDETQLVDVTVRVMGWVQDLEVDATGQQVRKGQVLFTFYSPELFAAQQELLLVAGRAAAGDALLNASRQRLRLWGMTDGQIDGVISRGTPMENVPLLSPASGYVMEKEVVAGASVMPGMKLYRIAPLDRVWIEAEVYEQDLPHARVGQQVTVTLPFGGKEPVQGKVSYVYPWLDPMTRTGKVRVTLANKDGQLKPDMYANVSFRREVGERLQVPASAVVYTGPRRLVFVDLGDDRLQPRVVELGLKGDEAWEVLSGLAEGEVVVTSGNFLIAAESRLRGGADHWGGGQ